MTSLPWDAGAATSGVRASARSASAKPVPPDLGEAHIASADSPWAPPPARLAGDRLPELSTFAKSVPDAPAAAGRPLAGREPDLAALRERARTARTRLSDQPLPIANQSSRLIIKLLGG